jgi:excisionase family DNA binding protein
VVGDGQDLLTLEEAAARLDVHYMTAYRYVRLGLLPATKRSGRWWVARRAVDGFKAGPAAAPTGRGDVRWRTLRSRLLSRMSAGDVGGAWSVVESAIGAGRDPLDLYVDLLAPVLRQVGDEWATAARSIQSEHCVSAVAFRLLGRIGPRGMRAGRRRTSTVILGGAPGDSHQMPLMMVVDVLRWEGFNVVDLGADVPLQSFVEAATTATDLVAVGVSLSVRHHRRSAADVFEALRSEVPDVRLLAGGPAVQDVAGARRLGADAWAPHAGLVPEALGATGG